MGFDDEIKKNVENEDDEPIKKGSDAPIDYEYEVGMVNANISVPYLALPE